MAGPVDHAKASLAVKKGWLKRVHAIPEITMSSGKVFTMEDTISELNGGNVLDVEHKSLVSWYMHTLGLSGAHVAQAKTTTLAKLLQCALTGHEGLDIQEAGKGEAVVPPEPEPTAPPEPPEESSPAVLPATPPGFTSMMAKFGGKCKVCGGKIVKGSPIFWSKKFGAIHPSCAEALKKKTEEQAKSTEVQAKATADLVHQMPTPSGVASIPGPPSIFGMPLVDAMHIAVAGELGLEHPVVKGMFLDHADKAWGDLPDTFYHDGDALKRTGSAVAAMLGPDLKRQAHKIAGSLKDQKETSLLVNATDKAVQGHLEKGLALVSDVDALTCMTIMKKSVDVGQSPGKTLVGGMSNLEEIALEWTNKGGPTHVWSNVAAILAAKEIPMDQAVKAVDRLFGYGTPLEKLADHMISKLKVDVTTPVSLGPGNQEGEAATKLVIINKAFENKAALQSVILGTTGGAYTGGPGFTKEDQVTAVAAAAILKHSVPSQIKEQLNSLSKEVMLGKKSTEVASEEAVALLEQHMHIKDQTATIPEEEDVVPIVEDVYGDPYKADFVISESKWWKIGDHVPGAKYVDSTGYSTMVKELTGKTDPDPDTIKKSLKALGYGDDEAQALANHQINDYRDGRGRLLRPGAMRAQIEREKSGKEPATASPLIGLLTDAQMKAMRHSLYGSSPHMPKGEYGEAVKYAIASYKGSGYYEINGTLRGEVGDSEKYLAKKANAKTKVAAIDKLFQQSPCKVPLTLYRKFESDALLQNADRLVGATIADAGFNSSAYSPDVWHGPWMMEIHVPAGYPALSIDKAMGYKEGSDWEKEVLLPRGTVYRVKAVDNSRSPRLLITEVVPYAEIPNIKKTVANA